MEDPKGCLLYTSLNMCMFIYTRARVCVCVCVCVWSLYNERNSHKLYFKHRPIVSSLRYKGRLNTPRSEIYSLSVELKFFVYCKNHISCKRLLISKLVSNFIESLSTV